MSNRYIRFCLLLALSFPAHSQKSAPEPPGRIEVAKHQLEPDPPTGPQQQKLDIAKMRAEATELSSLGQSLLADIAEVGQGKLPKDTTEKLKRIEKLSKHLRSELSP
jgi:hypothetical protein